MSSQLRERRIIPTVVNGAPGDIAMAVAQAVGVPKDLFKTTDPTPDTGVDLDIQALVGRFSKIAQENEALPVRKRQPLEVLAAQAVAEKLRDPALGLDENTVTVSDNRVTIGGREMAVLINSEPETIPADGAALLLEATNNKSFKTPEGMARLGKNSNDGQGVPFVYLTSPTKENDGSIRTSMPYLTEPDQELLARRPDTATLLSCSTAGVAHFIKAISLQEERWGQPQSLNITLPHAPTPSDDPKKLAQTSGYPHKTGAEAALGMLFPNLKMLIQTSRHDQLKSSQASLFFNFANPLAPTQEAAKEQLAQVLREYEEEHPGSFYFIEDKEQAHFESASRIPHAATVYLTTLKIDPTRTLVSFQAGYDNVYGYTNQILKSVKKDLASIPPHAWATVMAGLKQS